MILRVHSPNLTSSSIQQSRFRASNIWRHLVVLVASLIIIGFGATTWAVSTWNGNTSVNWGDGANWDTPPASGDALIFALAGSSGTALNNNLAVDFSISGITYNAGASAFTFGGNEITLTGNIANNGTNLETINLPIVTTAVRTVTMTNGGGNVTLGGVISGTGGGLTTAGIGTLTLNAANTYTGATTLVNVAQPAGVTGLTTPTYVVLGNANAVQNSTLTLPTANVNNNFVTINQIKFASGIGTFNLGGLAGGAGNGSTPFALLDSAGAPVTISVGANNASTTYNSTFTDSGNLVKVGTGTLTLGQGSNAWTGNITVNGGTLSVNGSGRLGAINHPGRTITVNSGATLTMTVNNIFGNGRGQTSIPSIVVNSGTLSSTRYNVLGDITLNGSTLTQAATDNVGTGDNSFHGYQFRGNVTVGGTAPSTITTTNGNANHLGPNTTFNVADVTGDANVDLTVTVPLVNQSGDYNDQQYNLNPSTAAASNNDRTARLTKTGAGTMLINAVTTYTGATTISGGTLKLQTTTTSNVPNTSAINVGGGATLDVTAVTGAGGFALGGTQTLNNNGTVAGGVTVGGTTSIKGTGSFTGAVTQTGGTIAAGNSTGIGALSMNSLTTSGGTLAFGIGGASSGAINVTNAATFTGGTVNLALSAIPTQTSYTVLTSGALSGTPTLATSAIGRTGFSLSTVGNSLQINVTGKGANVRFTGGNGNWDNAQTDANWTTSDVGIVDTTHFFDGDVATFNDSNGGQYNVNINSTVTPSAGITVSNNASTYVFGGGGGIAGLGSIVKSGTGALTLGTTNTHSGGTTLSAGTLNINNASALGTGTFTIGAGTTIDNTSGAAIAVSTASPQAWNGSFTFAGSNNLDLGTGAVTLNSNPTLTVNGTGVLTISGGIANGTGNSLTISGNGIVKMNGPNSYTGTTIINSGVTVQLGNSATPFGSNSGGSVTINAGGTFDVGPITTSNNTLNGLVQKQFFIAGDGVNGVGAITNSVAAVNEQNMFEKVTLTADASVGGAGRFDIRGFNGVSSPQNNLAVLDLAGHTFTDKNTNFFGNVGVEITDGNIVVDTNGGQYDIEATTNIKNFGTGTKITVNSAGRITFFDFRGTLTRPIVMNDNSFMGTNGGGNDNPFVGSNITLNGNVTFGVQNGNGGGTMTLNGVISETGGSRAITKGFNGTGTSTLILGASNTFTGGLTIQGGRVQLNNTGALNSTTPNAVTLTSSGVAGQPAPVLWLNGKSITVNGLNSTGGGGTNPAIVENQNITTNVTTPATLTVMVGSSPTFDGILRDGTATAPLSLATTGTGTFTLTGANTYTGSTNIGAGGTLQVGNGGATGAISGTTAIVGGAGTTLGFNSLTNLTVAAPISGGLTLNKDNANTLTLSGTSTYSGPTNVNTGTLSVTGSLTSAVNVNPGATLGGTGSVGSVVSSGILSPGLSPGTLTMSALTVSSGDYKVDVGTGVNGDLINVTGLAHYTGPSTITPQAVVPSGLYTILTAGNLTIDAGDTPTVTQIPGARVTFSLVTHTGVGGNLQLNVIGNAANLVWKGTVNTGGSFLWDINTTANWLNTGNNAVDKFFNADNVTFDDSATNKTVTLNTQVLPGSVTVNNSANDYTITGSGDISGSTGLTKTGSGKLTLSTANTYSGPTAVQNGTLVLGNAGALPANTAVTLGSGTTSGVLDLNGNSPTLVSLATSGTGAGNIIGSSSSTSSTLTVTGTNTFGGIIQDVIGTNSGQQLSLAVPSGTLTLTGNSTYTGSTMVSGGATLQLGNGGTTGSVTGTSTIDITGGTLIFNRSNTLVIGSPITVTSGTSGAVKQVGTGTTILAADNTYVSTTTISAGTLQIGNGGTSGNLGFGGATNNVVNNGTLVFNRSDVAPNVGQVISGTGGLVQNGTGTIILTGLNTFTGNVVVNAGTLVAQTTQQDAGTVEALGNMRITGRTITVNSGATLEFRINNVFGNQGNTTVNAVTADGRNLPQIIVNGGTLNSLNRYNQVGSVTLNGGTMSQTGENPAGTNGYDGWQFLGDFTVVGTAPSTISTTNGSSNHLGINTVFNVANVTGDANPDLIVSAPMRNRSGDYGTGAGSFIKTGPGTMVISALNVPTGLKYVNTYTGSTTVNRGTLKVDVTNGLNSASALLLGGGRLDTGGFNQSLGTLTVSAGSGIDLENGTTSDSTPAASILHFADSHSISWPGTLSIRNWSGTLTTGGGVDQVIFGTDNTGLTAGQLAQIHFAGYNGSTILPSGEVVPTAVSTRVLGDWDLNGSLSTGDIATMLTALTDLNFYKSSHGLTNDDLLNIGDVDFTGAISNGDIQAELNLIGGVGGGSVSGVPEPASVLLFAIGTALCMGARRRSLHRARECRKS